MSLLNPYILGRSVEQAVSLLGEYPFLGRDQLIELLCAFEIDPDTAWDLVTFVPIAYLRVLLASSGVRFSAVYILPDGDGESRTLSFAEQPVYQAALQHAGRQLSGGMAQEEIEPVILRSCEFEELNALLKEGARPDTIELSIPTLALEDGETAEEPVATEFPGPWWEFWK